MIRFLRQIVVVMLLTLTVSGVLAQTTNIKTDDFSGYTVGATTLSGYSVGTIAVSNTVGFSPSTQSVHSTNTAGAGQGCTYSTNDSASGNQNITGIFRYTGTLTAAGFQVFGRVTSAPFTTCYQAYTAVNTGLQLYKRVSGTSTQLGSTVGSSSTFTANIDYQITFDLQGTALVVTVKRLSDNNYLSSGGSWQSTATNAISTTDSSVTGAGQAGFRMARSSTNEDVYAEKFVYSDYRKVTTPSPSSVSVSTSGNVISLTGTNTSWVNGTTTFSLSGGTGASITSQSVTNATTASVTITSGSATGVNNLTISNNTDSSTATLSVTSTASFTVSPANVAVNSTGGVITLVGTNTSWVNGTTVFSLSGGTGASKTSQTVTDGTHATVTISAGSAAGANNLTISDNSDAATNTVSVTQFTPSPSSVVASTTGNVISLTGTGTSWVNGTTTFSLSGGTGASITAQSVSNSTTASITVTAGTATGTNNLTISDNSDSSTATLSVTLASQNIAPNSSAFYFSPGNWYVNGSSYAQTVNPGAYFKFAFTVASDHNGSGQCVVNVSGTGYTGSSVVVVYSLDGGALSTSTLTNSSTAISVSTTLAQGAHTLLMSYRACDASQDVWTTPVMSFKVTSITLDGSSSTGTPSTRSKKFIVYGDSCSYGVNVLRGNGYPTYMDGTLSPFALLSPSLDAEYGIVGFGSTGYSADTILGNVPRLWTTASATHTTWDKYFSSQSRLSAGKFIDSFDYVFLYEGTADYTNSMSDANVTAGATGAITAIRAATPLTTTPIYVIVPANRQKLSAVKSGFDAVAGGSTTLFTKANTTVYRAVTDSNLYLIDLGSPLSTGVSGPSGGPATLQAIDSIHPDTPTNGQIAAAISSAVLGAQSYVPTGRRRVQ